ncbi:hypothetical protein C4J88_2940 [Pseudomonas sp. R4-39-08]|uniref:hypothetical protein n=1 Tax=Pseudomonas sp. R4-39-08 TaxID=1173288 RepID=UPI000F570654|nr:hypothetical protein [Pseudomonas sp. R4-39-08]AZF37720.1 hypothetical protein C4J88_2940 [Pseudomonas sp. R4-39-08]
MTGMAKSVFNMLEKVFAAEVENRLPYQTKSKLAVEMEEFGYLELGSERMGTVSGYYLTNAGRLAYCEECRDVEEQS